MSTNTLIQQHQCLDSCQCSQKTSSSAAAATTSSVSVVEKQPVHLGYLIAEDLRANGIENPLLSNKKKMTPMSEAEKIAKIEG